MDGPKHVVGDRAAHPDQIAERQRKKSMIRWAISSARVSNAKWPAFTKDTSAAGWSRLKASAPGGRKKGSLRPQIAKIGGRFSRKYVCHTEYAGMFVR